MYRPDSNLALAAINKVQVGAGINILSSLEGSLSKLQELAGFNLSGGYDPFYSTNSLIPKYINKWMKSSSCSLTPTWKNFLEILKKMKEDSVSDQIEKYLIKSTAHIVNRESIQTSEATKGKCLQQLQCMDVLKFFTVSR